MQILYIYGTPGTSDTNVLKACENGRSFEGTIYIYIYVIRRNCIYIYIQHLYGQSLVKHERGQKGRAL